MKIALEHCLLSRALLAWAWAGLIIMVRTFLTLAGLILAMYKIEFLVVDVAGKRVNLNRFVFKTY